MVSAFRLETRNQYGVRDRVKFCNLPYVYKHIMFLLLSLCSIHSQQPCSEAVLMVLCPFFPCREEEAVTVIYVLLTVQIQEHRGQKPGKVFFPLPCSLVFNTQNADPNPNPLHYRCSMPLSPDFGMKQKARGFDLKCLNGPLS